MGRIVEFNRGRKDKKNVQQPITQEYSFTAEVEKDIEKLMKAIDGDRDKAIQMASDFYRRYPMLIEYVRSPEYMFRK